MATIAGLLAPKKKQYEQLGQYFGPDKKAWESIQKPPKSGGTVSTVISGSRGSAVSRRMGTLIDSQRPKTRQQEVQQGFAKDIFSPRTSSKKRSKVGAPPPSSRYMKGDPFAKEKRMFEAAYGSSKTKGFTWEDAPKRMRRSRPSGSKVQRPFIRKKEPAIPTTTKMKTTTVGVKEIKRNKNVPTGVRTKYAKAVVSKPTAKTPDAVKQFLSRQ